MAGVKNALTKCFGTSNPHNLVRATLDGLKRMRQPEEVLRERMSEGQVA
jgi:small subunit ribosomal protein S5